MTHIQILPGTVIAPRCEGALTSEESRILSLDIANNTVDLIHIQPRRSHGRLYFTGRFTREYDELAKQLDPTKPKLVITNVKPRADSTASAAELDAKYRSKDQKQSYQRRERRRRWRVILPLTRPENAPLLHDKQLRTEMIDARARALLGDNQDPGRLKRTKQEIHDLLNQYWAGGGTRGALTPFTGACGARGKPKVATKKLGRQNRKTRAGVQGVEGFIVTPHDQDIIQFSWRNYYVGKRTEAKACRKMWREFYSERTTDDSGRTRLELLLPHKRPTEAQFRTWGQKQSPDEAAWRKQLSSSIARMLDRSMLGNANDGIYAVGQRGAIDSTSTDMEFVSTLCRLDRIGQAYRIFIVDALHGYIAGFYLGLEAPSAETVKLAVLHAMTPKGPWLKWLGLDDQDLANWIPIHFTSFIADNTDARCEAVFVSLDAIGSGSLHVPVARSDQNSLVETAHHSIHRLVDHNLHGTTHGKPRKERGEASADDDAKHTILEAIRETARAVYVHNTMALDIEPTAEMRRELLDKGIPISRASLTALSIRQGRIARTLIDTDEARIHLLPITRGTFTRKSVVLQRAGIGKQRKFIKSVFYQSTHKAMLMRFRESSLHRTGRDIEKFDDDFRYDPYNPSSIYFRDPHSGELIELKGVSKDRELLDDCVYADILERQDLHDLERPETQAKRDQVISDMEFEQELAKATASDEYNADLEALGIRPSKAQLVANKAENREREKALYDHGMPTPLSEADDEDVPETVETAVANGDPPTRPPTPSPARPSHTTVPLATRPRTPKPQSIFLTIAADLLH